MGRGQENGEMKKRMSGACGELDVWDRCMGVAEK